jgi:NADPH:quinone reductase-like Zn-dependent oxidoreductase
MHHLLMLAMALNEPGPPEVLQPQEVPAPEPRAGEVRVEVRAAGTQPVDTMVRREGYTLGTEASFPLIPGNEFAGVVERVGDGVEGFEPGDEVIGFRVLRCYAELAVTSAEQVVPKPPGMPWSQAGSLSSSGQTAHRALERLGLGADQTILIHAAAGGVGTMAVQIARDRGATVIGTASEGNHDYLRALGAIPVAYGNGLVDRVRAVAPQGVDIALDAVGGEAIDASLELVPDRRKVATLVDFQRTAELGLLDLGGDRSAARLQDLLAMWERGALRVNATEYPLREAAEVHRLIETGHVRGKIALVLNRAAG